MDANCSRNFHCSAGLTSYMFDILCKLWSVPACKHSLPTSY